MEFTKNQLNTIRAFLAQVRERAKINRNEADAAMCAWIQGLHGWSKWDLVGDDIHIAIWWYRYRHKPRSKEWRAVIILRALIQASERDYVEPGQIEPDTAALHAKPPQMKRAKMMFIRKFGFETYRQKVQPILRRGGTKALLSAPATSEIREYVEILSKMANKTS